MVVSTIRRTWSAMNTLQCAYHAHLSTICLVQHGHHHRLIMRSHRDHHCREKHDAHLLKSFPTRPNCTKCQQEAASGTIERQPSRAHLDNNCANSYQILGSEGVAEI